MVTGNNGWINVKILVKRIEWLLSKLSVCRPQSGLLRFFLPHGQQAEAFCRCKGLHTLHICRPLLASNITENTLFKCASFKMFHFLHGLLCGSVSTYPKALLSLLNLFISTFTCKKTRKAHFSARRELEPLASLSDLGSLRDSLKVHQIRA